MNNKSWVIAAAFFFGQALAAPIPSPPPYYVLDEVGVLSSADKQSLEYLLTEHDRATSEQVVVAVFKTLGGEDLVAHTTEIFKQWRIGNRNRDNGVLLAVYWDEHQLRIEVGYGLEETLTDALSKRILDDELIPYMRQGEPGEGIKHAVHRILSELRSPILESPQAKIIVENRHLSLSPRFPARRSNAILSPWVVIIGFLVTFFGALAWWLSLAHEAHFTRAGWFPYRKRFLRKRRPHGLPLPPGSSGSRWWGGSNGNSGGWGGGGFSGGGGRSGGGGASGNW